MSKVDGRLVRAEPGHLGHRVLNTVMVRWAGKQSVPVHSGGQLRRPSTQRPSSFREKACSSQDHASESRWHLVKRSID
jgi:hypothetical protein